METAHAGDRPTLCGLLGGSFDPSLCRGRGVETVLEVKGAGLCGEVQAAADRPASSRAGEDAHPKTLGRWLLPAAGPRGVAVVTGVGRAFVAVTSALRERPPSSVVSSLQEHRFPSGSGLRGSLVLEHIMCTSVRMGSISGDGSVRFSPVNYKASLEDCQGHDPHPLHAMATC